MVEDDATAIDVVTQIAAAKAALRRVEERSARPRRHCVEHHHLGRQGDQRPQDRIDGRVSRATDSPPRSFSGQTGVG